MAKKQSNSKKKSPANYSKMKAVGFLKFIALIFPLLTYVIITTFVFPAPNSGFIFLGIIGSFIFGFGLVDIVGYLDNLNLGIQVSGFAFGLGGIMTGISSVIMYIPAIYATIDEQQVSYYFFIWVVILVSTIYYIFFRGAMKRYMRDQGASKSRISTLMTGATNFWLYKAANDSLNLRWMYHLNRLYVFFLLSGGTLHLLLGWSKILAPIIAINTIIILAFNIPMWSLVISTWTQGSSKKNDGYGIRLFFGYLLPVAAIAATSIQIKNLLFT